MLDEAGRPRAARQPDVPVTAAGRVGQRTLVAIHDHLRGELGRLREAVAEVAAGGADPAAARSLINRMTMRQNYWSLGAFCAAYCRVVTMHHLIEDERLFPDVRAGDPGLGPVLDRLAQEHEVIAGMLTDLDAALVALVAGSGTAEVRGRLATFADALESHLAYEESELLEPIGRLGVPI